MISKYNNKITEVDGIKFASKLEANVYKKCKVLCLDFSLQPRFTLMESFKFKGKVIRKIEYVADFAITINNATYIIDTKGIETDVFKIKKKLYTNRYNDEVICLKSVKAFEEWVKGVKANG